MSANLLAPTLMNSEERRGGILLLTLFLISQSQDKNYRGDTNYSSPVILGWSQSTFFGIGRLRFQILDQEEMIKNQSETNNKRYCYNKTNPLRQHNIKFSSVRM